MFDVTQCNGHTDNPEYRILMIGIREDVVKVMHELHRLGFAKVREWSPLQATGTDGEVLTILKHH